MSNTLKKVTAMLAELTSSDASKISADTVLFKDLDIESVEVMELEYLINEEFDITIDEQDLWKLPIYMVNQQMFQGGKITAQGVELLKHYPEISARIDNVAAVTGPNELYAILKIADIVELIDSKQAVCA